MCLQIYEHPNSLAHPNTKPNQIFYGPKKGPKLGLFAHVLNHMLPISSSKNGICKKIIIRTSTSFSPSLWLSVGFWLDDILSESKEDNNLFFTFSFAIYKFIVGNILTSFYLDYLHNMRCCWGDLVMTQSSKTLH